MEKDYTIAIDDDEIIADNTLIWRDLYAAQYALGTPFQLILADGNILHVEKVMRIITKKRMVATATWKGKSVVAKLFYDPESGKRHLEKEVAGVRALEANNIPTPSLYYVGTANDKRIKVLLFERIFHATNLQVGWEHQCDSNALLPQLLNIVYELATHHVLGILQKDLHLKNFLVNERQVYTLDGGQVVHLPHMLSQKESMDNLALFLSQLGVGQEAIQERLYKHYADARGWYQRPKDKRRLFSLIQQWFAWRWQRFSKKIFRESTEFTRFRAWLKRGMVCRDYMATEMITFLRRPDAVFKDKANKILKLGRSSTVIKVRLDDRNYVVKRYNMKGVSHRLRRMLRHTRAYQSWLIAQKLQLFFVPTAKPVAFIDKRWLGFRGKSYYMTEFVDGMHADDYFIRHHADEEAIDAMVRKICQLFYKLQKLGISHGDLKITNILVNQDAQPVIIDLDGAKMHASAISLRKAWKKELKRFLRNFDGQEGLKAKFKQALFG